MEPKVMLKKAFFPKDQNYAVGLLEFSKIFWCFQVLWNLHKSPISH